MLSKDLQQAIYQWVAIKIDVLQHLSFSALGPSLSHFPEIEDKCPHFAATLSTTSSVLMKLTVPALDGKVII